MPYLISMGTDCEAVIRIKADQQLQEIEKKYPGFIHVCLLITIDEDLFSFPAINMTML